MRFAFVFNCNFMMFKTVEMKRLNKKVCQQELIKEHKTTIQHLHDKFENKYVLQKFSL